MVRIKNTPQKNGSKVSSQKRLTVVQCWLMQGEEPDEKMQPILWTERPTVTWVCDGSLWPMVEAHIPDVGEAQEMLDLDPQIP